MMKYQTKENCKSQQVVISHGDQWPGRFFLEVNLYSVCSATTVRKTNYKEYDILYAFTAKQVQFRMKTRLQ